MSYPLMRRDLQMRQRLLEGLSKKRNYKQEMIDLVRRHKFVVFYGCGAFFNNVTAAWFKHTGRKIDYCCDSDSAKWGRFFQGIPCLSPEALSAIKDQSSVFVTVGDFEPLCRSLAEKGFPSVHLIYKYDLDIADSLENSDSNEVADKLYRVYSLLSDERSLEVFEAIVKRVFGRGDDIYAMARVCEKDQYFPAGIFKLSGHESFVDAGAFNGDTVKDFMEHTGGKFDDVFAFELDAANYDLLKDRVNHMSDRERIQIYNLGLWDSDREISYSLEQFQSAIGGGQARGRVVPLDEVLGKEKVTYIKMDIEGAELQALRGARNIIQAQKPKLAVCVYHDFRHLWEIPLCLKELVPEYKIYLRHYTNLEYETVCYAVCQD